MSMQNQYLKYLSQKLSDKFYQRTDVVLIAKELLGKILVTNFNNQLTAGRIVETEAYNGPFDKAAHSYNNKRTSRTEVMYMAGGVAYVYLCYGLHQMFNIVTNTVDNPNAILIRALEPIAGKDIMLERTNKTSSGFGLTKGPGNVGKALGFNKIHSGMSLQGAEIFIADDGLVYQDCQIVTTQRIGVGYAKEDALLPYRFLVSESNYISGNKTQNLASKLL
jgi:DNA-3-methyladenine glycosylase